MMRLLLLVLSLVLSASLGFATSVKAATFTVNSADEDLQAVLNQAQDGDTVLLGSAVWTGNFTVPNAITLRGNGAVLDAGGEGTTLTVQAPGTVIENLQLQGTGEDRGGPDTCIYVSTTAAGSIVRKNRLTDCLFGIWVHKTRSVQVLDNHVVGRSHLHPSMRGNGIHLFHSTDLVVRSNHVTGARDGIYISATDDSVFEDNTVENQRFGVHYMYSQRNTLRGNTSRNNKSAYALMQSHDLLVENNYGAGSTEHGILFRDAQYCVIRNNVLEDNVEGMFFYSSTENEIYGNRIVGNEVGAKVWAGTLRNDIHHNAFVANQQQIFYVSSSDLQIGSQTGGNYWSDYLGWDQDGDGLGDRSYRVDSFLAKLFFQYPAARLLMSSPALELLGHLQGDLPFLKVPTVVDRFPLLADPTE